MADLGKIGITPGGEYNSETTYEPMTIVTYGDGAYMSIVRTQGHDPTDTDCWMCLVQNVTVPFTQAAELENIESGEPTSTIFGKLAKAISTLMDHIKATASSTIAGHVKLSNSSAITEAGQYALDAVEKNASVEGSLANQIKKQTSIMEQDGSHITFISRKAPMLLNDWNKNYINIKNAESSQENPISIDEQTGTLIIKGTSSWSGASVYVSDLIVGEKYFLNFTAQKEENSSIYVTVHDGKKDIAKGSESLNFIATEEKVRINFYSRYTNGDVASKTTYSGICLDRTRHLYVPYSGYQIKTCGKNMLENRRSTYTVNGITVTVNPDKSVSIKGTVSALTVIPLDTDSNLDFRRYGTNRLIISGCDGGASGSSYKLEVERRRSGKVELYVNCYGDEVEFDTTENDEYHVRIVAYEGAAIDTVIYPMIRLAFDTDQEYEPYISSSITVSNDTKTPVNGLQSYEGTTAVFNDYGASMSVSYANNASGVALLTELCSVEDELISHEDKKSSDTVAGHVKLSDSSAITETGEYALDAVEKNASVEGSLANQISEINSSLKYKTVDCDNCNSIKEIFDLLDTMHTIGTGTVGDLNSNNLKNLLGSPGIGNYVSVELARHSSLNVIHVTAYQASGCDMKTGILYYNEYNYVFSGWR